LPHREMMQTANCQPVPESNGLPNILNKCSESVQIFEVICKNRPQRPVVPMATERSQLLDRDAQFES
jgi:hypothetical protein